MSANAWIASGAIVVALATGLSRTGDYSLVYLGQLIGIALMFCGFTFAGRKIEPVPARRPDRTARTPGTRAMTIDGDALRSHAREVSQDRFLRKQGRLRELSLVELEAVAEIVDAIGQGVADCLLETADADPAVATVLSSLYPVGTGAARG